DEFGKLRTCSVAVHANPVPARVNFLGFAGEAGGFGASRDVLHLPILQSLLPDAGTESRFWLAHALTNSRRLRRSARLRNVRALAVSPLRSETGPFGGGSRNDLARGKAPSGNNQWRLHHHRHHGPGPKDTRPGPKRHAGGDGFRKAGRLPSTCRHWRGGKP